MLTTKKPPTECKKKPTLVPMIKGACIRSIWMKQRNVKDLKPAFRKDDKNEY